MKINEFIYSCHKKYRPSILVLWKTAHILSIKKALIWQQVSLAIDNGLYKMHEHNVNLIPKKYENFNYAVLTDI